MLCGLGAGLLALAGLGLWLVLHGGSALILLLKLGKLLVLPAIALWLLLKSTTSAQAPALFAALDRMRAHLLGPAFGLVGWPRNYLLLGLPLLEGMSEAEALSVVAHEYGHLAGSYRHFAAFVYRLRLAWGTLQAVFEQQSSRLGRGPACAALKAGRERDFLVGAPHAWSGPCR